MGVLKRFSYDNIVIHDPTAPDPVDYDGGGEGGGGYYIVHVSDDGEGGYTADKSVADMIASIESGIIPVVSYNTPMSPPFFGSTAIIPLTSYTAGESGAVSFVSPIDVVSGGANAYMLINTYFTMYEENGEDHIEGGSGTYSVVKAGLS